MKIIFAAPMMRICDFGRSCGQALMAMGHDVTLWDYRKIADEQENDEEANRLLEKHIQTTKPDLLFVVKGERLKRSVVKFAEKMGAVTALWNVDDPHIPQLTEGLSPVFKHVFTPCGQRPSIYHKMGIEPIWLPLTCSKQYISSMSYHQYEYSVLFIGTLYPGRTETIAMLKQAGIDVRHFGTGWSDTQRIGDLEAITATKKAKINLVINQRANTEFGVVNPRTFEVLAANSFLIAGKHFGLISLIENQGLIPYNSPEELPELVKTWLNKDEERRTIACTGYKLFMTAHRPIHRMKAALKAMQL